MAGCDAVVVMILLTFSQFFGGFAYAGFYNPNILDLAPPYAGTLFGISNTLGNMNGFIAPQLAGYIIRDNEYTVDGWSNVWISCLVLQLFGGSFYAAVATADRQPWADEPMTIRDQLKFEVDQFLFRKDSIDEELDTEMTCGKPAK